jgi:crotonobetainyl-CoA:carnitine CoA-transferase CaiB-like acyl-CoA transferase
MASLEVPSPTPNGHSPTAGGGSVAARPLDGIRVVEVGSYISGPWVGLMLAELGADVVKVEPPRGDPMRTFGLRHNGLSALWVNCNHDKQSVVIDLKSADGHKQMLDLVASTDILIQNWRPGVAESLNLPSELLQERNPRLIQLIITGFGGTGPRSRTPVFDLLLQATSGLAAMEATETQPTAVRSLVADKATATFGVQAVLAALIARERTGNGSRAELAMLDVMAYFDFPDLGQDRTFLAPEVRHELRRGRPAILRTSDGYLAISPVSGRQIGNTVAAVGHPEWKDDLKQLVDPTELMDEVYNRVEQVTRTGPTAHWLGLFEEFDVPAAAVLTPDEHFADPQVQHNRLYTTTDSPAGPVRRVRYPALFDGQVLAPRRPAPALGQDTEAVLGGTLEIAPGI